MCQTKPIHTCGEQNAPRVVISDSGCTRGPAVSRSRIAPYRSLKCRFALVLCRGGCGRRRLFRRASILLFEGVWGTPTGSVPLCHFVTFPPHCGGIVPSPTAWILDGRNKLIESQQARSFTGKHRTLLGFPRIAQLPSRLFRLFRARDVRNPRSITSPYFALTGQRCHPAWACGPMLGLWGSSGSEMPSHFRKCARLRRAQRGYALQGRALR